MSCKVPEIFYSSILSEDRLSFTHLHLLVSLKRKHTWASKLDLTNSNFSFLLLWNEYRSEARIISNYSQTHQHIPGDPGEWKRERTTEFTRSAITHPDLDGHWRHCFVSGQLELTWRRFEVSRNRIYQRLWGLALLSTVFISPSDQCFYWEALKWANAASAN